MSCLKRPTKRSSRWSRGDRGHRRTFYSLTLRPALWRTSLRQNSRIFQKVDPLTIINTLLDERGITDVAFAVSREPLERARSSVFASKTRPCRLKWCSPTLIDARVSPHKVTMFKTNIRSALPPMRAGERESRAGGEQYCLSPLPLPVNSKYAVDVAHIDVRHDDATMDIRQGASPDSMVTVGHVFSGLFVTMMVFFLVVWVGIGGFPPDPQLAAAWGGAVFRCSFYVCSWYRRR